MGKVGPRQQHSHFSQNLPVKPSTQRHCCQDQRSRQVPPCLQGLAVQAPSSLGHLRTHKPTIRQSDGGVGGGGGGRAGISLLVEKKRKRICMLKDPSWLFTGRFSGILQCVPSVRNLPFRGIKASFSSSLGLEQMSHGGRAGAPTARKSVMDRKQQSWADEYGPVKDAARRQRLTGLQRAAVHGQLHDAADKVVGGDLPAPMKDGLY